MSYEGAGFRTDAEGYETPHRRELGALLHQRNGCQRVEQQAARAQYTLLRYPIPRVRSSPPLWRRATSEVIRMRGREMTNMDMPGAQSLMEMVRTINQMSRRARAGEPGLEDYLRAVSADPVTEWFTALLQEKNDELQTERERSDRLASALRAWSREVVEAESNGGQSDTDLRLLKVLRGMGIIQR